MENVNFSAVLKWQEDQRCLYSEVNNRLYALFGRQELLYALVVEDEVSRYRKAMCWVIEIGPAIFQKPLPIDKGKRQHFT